LVVKDENNLLRDNHWGSSNKARIFSNTSSDGLRNNFSPLTRYDDYYKMYPEIPTDDLNEWYFICATYNPDIREVSSTTNLFVRGGTSEDGTNYGEDSKRYWLNHQIRFNTETRQIFIDVGSAGDIVANSLEGAKCKVEIISKSDLLKARGYKISDLTIDTDSEDGEVLEDNEIDIPPVDDINEEEEDSNIEPNPMLAPNGFNPMTNPMTGTLSPQGQWIWNGVSMTWLPVEIEEEETEEETQEEDSNIEPNPMLAPNGFNPMTNPMTGTLSPQGQWSWNGVSMTWLPVEIEEEEETEEEDSNVEQMPTNPPVGFNPMTNNFMQGTLSPQGQWRWTGQGMTWAAVDSGGY